MAKFISLVKSQSWKPPVKLFDCSAEYLKHCPIDYQSLTNPFSSKSEQLDPEEENKLWRCLGVVHPVSDERVCDEAENPFHATSVAPVHSKREQKRIRRADRQNRLTGWYDMRRSEPTSEDREDMEVVRLRQAISSDVHVRRSDTKLKFFQRGVVIDDPGNFYDRVPRKKRGRTIVDELLTNAELLKKQRRRYVKVERTNAERRAAIRRQKQQRLKHLKTKSGRRQPSVIVPNPTGS